MWCVCLWPHCPRCVHLLHSHSQIELQAYTIWHSFQSILNGLYRSRQHQRNSAHLSWPSCEESPRSEKPTRWGGRVRVWLLSLLANSTKFLYSGQQHKCEIFIRDLTKKMKNKWKPRFHGLPDSQRFLDEIYMRFCFMCAQSLMAPFSGSACVTSEAFNLKNIMLKILTPLAWGMSSLRKQLQTLWPGTNSMDQN